MSLSDRHAPPPPVAVRLAVGLAIPAIALALAFLGAWSSPLALALVVAMVLAAVANLVLLSRIERTLEIEIGARERAEQEARVASQARDEALATVSHDLRTGLNGVIRDRGDLRLLVVDDNAINRKVAFSQLRALGYSVAVVESGAEALAILAEESYDAVLMDCQMPGLDGWETTRRWRRQESGPPIPVIGVTAHALKGTRAKCLAAGMDDVVTKPLRGRMLEEALGRWLQISPPAPQGAPQSAPPASVEIERPSPTAGAVDPRALESLADLERTGGEANLLSSIIDSYLGEGSRYFDQMRRAVAEGDHETLEDSAHDLGGSSVYLGARPLARLCSELVDLARQGDLEPAAARLGQTQEEYRRVEAELERIRRQGSPAVGDDPVG